jgi:hypothetical protein
MQMPQTQAGQHDSNFNYDTDQEARLYKKSYSKESKLDYLEAALVENRYGIIAAALADAHAERGPVLSILKQRPNNSSRRITVGADNAHEALLQSFGGRVRMG